MAGKIKRHGNQQMKKRLILSKFFYKINKVIVVWTDRAA